MSSRLENIIKNAVERQEEAKKEIEKHLKDEDELYYACREYLEITDFLDTLDDLDGEDEGGLLCGKSYTLEEAIARVLGTDEDKAKDSNGDGMVDTAFDEIAARAGTARDNLLKELAKAHKGEPIIETKIARSEDGEDWQEMPLNEAQKKKVVDLLTKGKMDELTDYLDNMLDENIASLQDHLPQLGEDLKDGRKELREKKERTEKENERLEALERLFKRVREAFSDD